MTRGREGIGHPGIPPETTGDDDSLPARNNPWAMFSMVVGMFGYSANDAFVKVVSEDGLALGQIIFIRGVFATCMVAGLGLMLGKLTWPRTIWHPMIGWRSLGEVGSTVCFLSALFALPIGSVTAVLQISPLMITAASAIFLREHVGLRRWLAAIAGILGVALIIRPGSEMFQASAIFALAAVAFMTLRDLTTAFVPGHFSSVFLSLMNTIVVSALGLALFPFEVWVMPTGKQIALLFAASVFITIGFYFLIESTRFGDPSRVSPFRYSIVIWAVASGYLVWGEVPDVYAWVGIAIVVGAGLYTFHRERQATGAEH